MPRLKGWINGVEAVEIGCAKLLHLSGTRKTATGARRGSERGCSDFTDAFFEQLAD